MKFLNVTLLLFLLTGSAAAQATSSTPSAPDVAVIKISWRRVESNSKLEEDPNRVSQQQADLERAQKQAISQNRARASAGQPQTPIPTVGTAPPSPTVRPWTGYVYEFKVMNTGAKTIRKLVWEHVFIDLRTQQKIGRRQYKSKMKIRPGMTANLVARSDLPPIGTLDVTQVNNNPQDQSSGQMVIQRIEYTDGSVWTPASK
jgi:hypothetical protein